MLELRRYTLQPGQLRAMQERFTNLTLPLFKEIGITLVGAWTDHDDADAFLFMVSFPDRETRERAWDRYHADDRYLAARETQSQTIQDIAITFLDDFPGGEAT
jgi:hypothetical protein